MAAFVVLVLGESIINVTFVARGSQVGRKSAQLYPQNVYLSTFFSSQRVLEKCLRFNHRLHVGMAVFREIFLDLLLL
jgi:hypothetical protein